MGNKECRMNDYEWINEYKVKLGEESFRDFVDRVYDFLNRMKVGDQFVLSKHVRPENIDLFVKVACLYIQESKAIYEFDDEYEIIKRHG